MILGQMVRRSTAALLALFIGSGVAQGQTPFGAAPSEPAAESTVGPYLRGITDPVGPTGTWEKVPAFLLDVPLLDVPKTSPNGGSSSPPVQPHKGNEEDHRPGWGADQSDKEYQDALREYYQNYIDAMKHEIALRGYVREALEWHLKAANWMLVLVIAVLGFGLVVSFWEVRRSLRFVRSPAKRSPSGEAKGSPSGTAIASHVIQVAPTSVQITTAATGIVVLLISLGFVYLFVDKVLPVEVVELGSQAPANIEPLPASR